MKYEIIKGDLLDLRESVDAIVISNRNRPGIYNAVGYGFWEYCLKLKREELAVGDCKTIQWPKLKSPYVIYVLCPSYKDSLNPKQELVKAYQSVFKEAERQGLKKLLFHCWEQTIRRECLWTVLNRHLRSMKQKHWKQFLFCLQFTLRRWLMSKTWHIMYISTVRLKS